MTNKLNDKSYLLVHPETKIPPPAEIKFNELPIDKLSWLDFEKLCLRLAQTIHSIDNCEIYGVPGSKQEGIDIFAFKESQKYECFQCKKYQKIFPGKLEEIIKEFKNGDWFSKSDKFYLCTSLSLNSTRLQNKFNVLKEDLKKSGIELVKWDSVQINRILKKHPDIVLDFFGDQWCKLFSGEKYLNSSSFEFQNLTEKIDTIFELINKGQNTGQLNSIVEEVYDKEYYWIESEKVKLFNEVLKEYNNTIIDKRKKFTFTQKVIQSIFSLSELNEIVDDWNKDSFSPENLDHFRFIHSGLLAYSCLEKIPKDVLLDLKLLNWCPIHYGYYSGHLVKFVREIEFSMKQKKDLITQYSSDRYLFENLTRIINSLKNFLEFNVDELYIEKPKASIARNLPKKFVLVTTTDELTLRNPMDLNQVYAKLPLDKQLAVFKIEIIKTPNSTIIIGINARDCFHWNPEKDLVAHFFYQVTIEETITDIFCKIKYDGKIETTLQIGKKVLVFIDFNIEKTFYLNSNFKLAPYKNSFVGIKRNYLNSSGSLVYKLSDDFKEISIITIEDLREIVNNFNKIVEWKETLEINEDLSIFYELQNIDFQIINYNTEELLLLNGSIEGTGVIVLIRILENEFNILYLHHLKESSTIAIDSTNNVFDLTLYCAYLDLRRRDSVFETIIIQNFNTTSSQTISRVRKSDNCRDILGISVSDTKNIYLNEGGSKLLLYINNQERFEEYIFEKQKIHFMKFIN